MANVVESLTESVKSMGVKAAYGDPVEVDGVPIVPVSVVWFGFGGGQESGGSDGAMTGGGGGASIPIGAYVPGIDGPAFKPNLIALLWVSIPVIVAGGTALSKLVRALKR